MAWLSTTASTAATSSICQSIIGTNVNVAEAVVGYNYYRCSKHHFPPSSSLTTTISTINYPKLSSTTRRRRTAVIRAEAESPTPTQMATTTIEKSGVKIVKNPPESSLSELGVRNWPKWGCPPSKFPWTYSSKETCYLLKGKVKVYPEGSDEVVEIGAGDLVEFPNGMSCTWDVSEAVDKHYKFD